MCELIEYCEQRLAHTVQLESGNKFSVKHTLSSDTASLWRQLFRLFLPEGFPSSVTPDYLGFQFWDSVQALCSYVRGIITSKAILTGMGVGSQAATPLSAVFQFFVRDFTGMLGGVIFACCQGSGLDAYAKQWRLFADCFNNVGYALELASPHFPGSFLLLACLGNVARAITGVAGGATRAALTQHFAREGNAADVAAKEGSQETATTLVGMLVGMAVTQAAGGSSRVLWSVFLLLTALHIFANIRAVRCLHLTSLNRSRLDILVSSYLRGEQSKREAKGARKKEEACGVMSSAEVAALEPLFPPPLWGLVIREQPPIILCPSLTTLASAGEVQQLLEGKLSRPFFVVRQAQPPGDFVFWCRQGCSTAEQLESYLQLRFRRQLPPEKEREAAAHAARFAQLLRASGAWNLERLSLGAGPWRYELKKRD